MNGRIYDPLLGRFLSADLVVQFPGSLQSYNRYSYVRNNPLTTIDPTGFIERDANGQVVTSDVGQPFTATHKSGEKSTFQQVEIKADDGSKIVAYRNEGSNQHMDTDCHGTTFTDGKLWINDNQVPTILKGDHYSSTTAPKPGDVGVYTDKNGAPVHSVTVQSVDPKTGEVTVYGKGGVEPAPHSNPATPGPGGGWTDPTATITYYEKPAQQAPSTTAATAATSAATTAGTPAPTTTTTTTTTTATTSSSTTTSTPAPPTSSSSAATGTQQPQQPPPPPPPPKKQPWQP